MTAIRENTRELLFRPILDSEWQEHLERVQRLATEALDCFLEHHPEIDFPVEAIVRREEGTNNLIVRLKTPPKLTDLN